MQGNIQKDLTKGSVTKAMLLFAGPLMLGNMLQQLYNIVDTLIVGRCLGADALASVGSSFTLISFLTSMILGLCMGSGALFSILFGAGKEEQLKRCLFLSFLLIGTCMIILNAAVLCYAAPILHILQVPEDIFTETEQYIRIIFYGLGFTFLYNYFACVMRAIGNSVMPLVFLAVSTALNIGLDLLFILVFGIGCLFLLYGLYRGIGKPEMSIVLTVISLGTRVLLAYALSPIPSIGLTGIWSAIPIGWILADMTGLCYYIFLDKRGGAA